jgi:hypothetical protein
VIHPGALGDVLLAVPALRALRAGGDGIVVAAQPRIGALLVALGVADRALPFDTLGLDALFTDAPLAADAPLARHAIPAARVVCWFGARDAHFAQRLRAIAPDAVLAAPSRAPTPVWRHLLDTVGTRADREPIAVAPGLIEQGGDALRAAGWDGRTRVVVVHPGAGGAAKRWPVDGFVDVIDGIDATLVVHEGPADTDAVRAFTARARRPALRLLDPSLPALAGVLATAAAYLGNDSGVSHLAAAVGARAVVLFTEAARPWAPWSPTARCLTVTTSTLIDAERAAVHAALRMVL